MYEHLKMRELLTKIDAPTIDELRNRWPDIEHTNRTAKEIFHKLDVEILSHLYEIGLANNTANLTVLSVEALIQRDNDFRYRSCYRSTESSITQDIVVKKLQNAFDNHQIVREGTLVNALGFTLLSKCYEYDYLLAKYGHELPRSLIFMGPEDWFKETLKHSKRAPLVARKIPWANALLGA